MENVLMFGIELEFFAVYPNGIWYDPAAQGHHDLRPNSPDQAAQAITDALTKACLSVDREPEFHIYGNEEKDYSKWRIGSDWHSLTDEENACLPEGYCFEAIELVSRKMKFHSDDWAGEIRNVLKVVKALANAKVRFVTNSQCGFHVHVGLDGREWPLHILKHLLQFVTAFEWCFDSIHSAARIRHPVHTSSYLTPSSFFLHREQVKKLSDPFRRPENPQDWLIDIDAVDSAEELCKLFHNHRESFYTSGHNSAYNFDNLVSKHIGKSDPTGTIEFRQHAGTLDFNDICSWVRLVCRVVLWVNDCTWPSPVARLSSFIHDRNFDLGCIFNAIELDDLTWEHYCRRTSTRWDEARRRGRQIAGAASHGTLHALVLAVEQRKYANTNYGTVMSTINEKFRTGGYGEWNATFSTLFKWEGIFGTEDQQWQEAEERRRMRERRKPKDPEMENMAEKLSKLGIRTHADETGMSDEDADIKLENSGEDEHGDDTQRENSDAEGDDTEEDDVEEDGKAEEEEDDADVGANEEYKDDSAGGNDASDGELTDKMDID